MRIAYNSVAREGKGREAALASGVHALHLPVPVPRAAAAPLPANTPAGSNPRAVKCRASICASEIAFHGLYMQEKRLHDIYI